MITRKNIAITMIAAFVLLFIMAIPFYATYSVSIMYNTSGGIVEPIDDSVTIKDGFLTADSSEPITLKITPNDGYILFFIQINDREIDNIKYNGMEISINPLAGDNDIKITFLEKSILEEIDNPDLTPDMVIDENTTNQEIQTPPISTETISQNPQNTPTKNDSFADPPLNIPYGTDSFELDTQILFIVVGIIGACIISFLIMLRMFRKKH